MNGPVLPEMENPDQRPPATIGDNNPPEPIAYDVAEHARLDGITNDFILASDLWNNTALDNRLASQLADQITGLREHLRRVNDQRIRDKKPHDDLSAAVQAAYRPMLDRLDAAIAKMKGHLGKYITEREREVEAERARKAEAARRAQEEARLAAMEADRSIDAQVEAAAAAERAKLAQAEAARAARQTASVQSASGAGRTFSQRTRRRVEITNIRHVFMHYQDRPEVRETLERLANSEVNSKGFPADGKIPGTEIHIVKTTA